MPFDRRLLVGLSVVILACDAPRGLPGVWTGTVQTAATSTFFTLTLTETEQGVVSGGGRITSTLPGISSVNFAATVTGAHAHPAVTLAIVPVGATSMNFSGGLDATLSTLNGVLFGSGFGGDSLRLTRNTPAVSGRLTAP